MAKRKEWVRATESGLNCAAGAISSQLSAGSEKPSRHQSPTNGQISIPILVSLGMIGPALANNECGPDTVGPNVVNCAPGDYTFIRYTVSDGITVNLDDALINVHNTNLAGILHGVAVHNSVTDNDLVINANNFGTVETDGDAAFALYTFNGGSGDSIIRQSNGAVVTHGISSHGIYAVAGGTGNAIAEMNGGSISTEGLNANGLFAYASTTSDSADASATMTGGTITTLGTGAEGVAAVVNSVTSSGSASARMTGGSVDTAGEQAVGLLAQSNGLGTAIAVMTGGTITTSATQARGVWGLITNGASTADTTVAMNGGVVTTTGDNRAHGIEASTAGSGSASVLVAGSSQVTSTGEKSDAVLAASAGGTYVVDVQGGTLTGGALFGAGVHTVAAAGGTVTIGAGATVNAGASGIAIRDGDYDYDGVDEIGGNATITTNGTVTGDAVLGLGDDTFNLTGGTFSGDIYGDDVTASLSDGNDIFTWSGGTLNSAIYGQNGSDTLSVSAGGYDGTQVLDGGDDALSADGWVDVLTLSGVAGVVVADASTTLLNWETLVLDSSTATINGLETENVQLNDSTLTLGDATVTQAIGGGAGVEQLTLGGATAVAGDVSLGDGSDSLTLDGPDATIGGAIDGGAGSDTLSFINGVTGTYSVANWENAAVASGSDVTLGTSTFETLVVDGAAATLTDSAVSGTLTGGTNDDTVTLTGTSSIGGNVTLGDGSDALTLDGTDAIIGGAIDGGAGSDTLSFINGVIGAFSVDNWEVAAVTSGSDVTLSDGTVIEVQVADAAATLIDLAVTGNVNGSAGDETVALSGSTSVTGNVALGDGSDTLTLSGSQLNLNLVDGGDDLGSADGFVDSLILDGFAGALESPQNWEQIQVQGGSDLELIGDTAFGRMQILDGNVDLGDGPMALSGDMAIGSLGMLTGTGGGSGFYAFNGNVANSGIITTQDGAAGDTLHFSGNYSSDGGALLVDVVLAGDDSPADKAVFEADIDGTTTLNVNNAGGAGAQTDEGIVVIETAASPGDFVLDGDYITEAGEPVVVGGAYVYRLEPAADGTWRLSSFFEDMPGEIAYQPLVPAYEVLSRTLLALDELPTLQQRVGNRSWLLPGSAAHIDAEGTSAWVRVAGSSRDMISEASTTDAAYDMTTTKLQVGVDVPVEANIPGRLVVGVNGTYADSQSDVDSIYGSSDIDSTGYGLGLTGTWYGDDGSYVDGQFRYTWTDTDVSAPGASSTDGIDGAVYAFSVEAGKRIFIDESKVLSVTPQAQLRYARADISDKVGAYGERIVIDDAESLVGRLGVSLDSEKDWSEGKRPGRSHTYVLANVLHEFSDRTETTVAGVAFDNRIDDWALELGIGGSYNWADDKYSVYGEISRASSLDDFSENTELKGDIGVRVQF